MTRKYVGLWNSLAVLNSSLRRNQGAVWGGKLSNLKVILHFPSDFIFFIQLADSKEERDCTRMRCVQLSKFRHTMKLYLDKLSVFLFTKANSKCIH